MNEEGVGLGPTTEFFTLLSHEFQRRRFGLWEDTLKIVDFKHNFRTVSNSLAYSVELIKQSGVASLNAGNSASLNKLYSPSSFHNIFWLRCKKCMFFKVF